MITILYHAHNVDMKLILDIRDRPMRQLCILMKFIIDAFGLKGMDKNNESYPRYYRELPSVCIQSVVTSANRGYMLPLNYQLLSKINV